MQVFFSPKYCETAVAFDTTRKAAALAQSLVDEPIDGASLVEPKPASRDELVAVHDEPYVDAVLTGEPRELAVSNAIGWDPDLATAVLWSTGGVRDAALTAWHEHTIAGSLSSGLHHAYADRGSGYCTVNGLVVAAHAVLAAGAQRVLILDLDAHCGGGTASMIDHVDGIEQVDVAVDPFDRYLGSANAGLTMSDGVDYLEVVGRVLEQVADPVTIDLVLYNAGMDPHRHAGGHPAIDEHVLAERERMVFEWADGYDLPVAWVLAGGYTDGRERAEMHMPDLVALHRLTITTAAASAVARSPRDTPR